MDPSDRCRVNGNLSENLWNPPPPEKLSRKELFSVFPSEEGETGEVEVKPGFSQLAFADGRNYPQDNLQRLSSSYSTSDPVYFGDLEDQLINKVNRESNQLLTPGTREKWRLVGTQQGYNAEVICIDDSDEEETASLRSSESTEPVQPITMERQEQYVSTTFKPLLSSSENEWVVKANKYKNNFITLRHLYDKFKQDNAELKMENEELKMGNGELRVENNELKMTLEATNTEMETVKSEKENVSAELLRLQAKMEIMENELLQKQARIEALESMRTENASNVDELQNNNWRLAKLNEELQSALKDVFMNQMTAFNFQKQLVEKSKESCKRICREAKPDEGSPQQEQQQVKRNGFEQSGEVTAAATVSTNAPTKADYDDLLMRQRQDSKLARKFT